MHQKHRLLCVRSALRRALLGLDHDGKWVDDLFRRLCAGEVKENPFPEELVKGLANYSMEVFDHSPMQARVRKGNLAQPVRIRLLQALLHEASDPDAREWSTSAAE